LKPVIIILAIIAIIWVLNAYCGIYIDNTSGKLLNYIDTAKIAVKAKDVDTLNAQVKQLRSEWEGMESHWEVLVDHREIDRIDTLMTHLEAMSSIGSLDTIMPELEELAFYLTHIDDKHKIRPENILQRPGENPSALFCSSTACSNSPSVAAESSYTRNSGLTVSMTPVMDGCRKGACLSILPT
jgi:hypothetical protein